METRQARVKVRLKLAQPWRAIKYRVPTENGSAGSKRHEFAMEFQKKSLFHLGIFYKSGGGALNFFNFQIR